MSEETTSPPDEQGGPCEIVELLVPARERGRVARALLQAADEQGLPPGVVLSTSTGYRVPRRVADAADVALAESVNDGGPLPGTQVYAAAVGRPGFRRDGEQPVDPEAVPDPELPEQVAKRGKGRR
ncbi:hypothetical protein AB0F17_28715 [Nonomuraea sp. NPDC026600]|uniref:hypothetical protein n=1 Tax=Nonomuraea sp. NPDC026600 TaxID=3155363 RepID=UPI00340DF81B